MITVLIFAKIAIVVEFIASLRGWLRFFCVCFYIYSLSKVLFLFQFRLKEAAPEWCSLLIVCFVFHFGFDAFVITSGVGEAGRERVFLMDCFYIQIFTPSPIGTSPHGREAAPNKRCCKR